MINLSFQPPKTTPQIDIKGSKSETNRLLILKALGCDLRLSNESSSEDTRLLKVALQKRKGTVDIGMAGTAMRFLTVYYAVTPDVEVVLTGSERMKQRPIAPLVEALRSLGAQIDYEGETGYPPLRIRGAKMEGGKSQILATESSQYITALLLAGGFLKRGLQLQTEGKRTSSPYISMTAALLQSLGFSVSDTGDALEVEPFRSGVQMHRAVESDWSSASYYYALVALAPPDKPLFLTTFSKENLQGDARVAEIYRRFFGVQTVFKAGGIELKKSKAYRPVSLFEWDFSDTPDLAQTVAVTCLGLRIPARLRGLQTLKIKETDRILALYEMLGRCGAEVAHSDRELSLKSFRVDPEKRCVIETYNDHRMAMAFACLAPKLPIRIKTPEVVEKSYPEFWRDFEKAGVRGA